MVVGLSCNDNTDTTETTASNSTIIAAIPAIRFNPNEMRMVANGKNVNDADMENENEKNQELPANSPPPPSVGAISTTSTVSVTNPTSEVKQWKDQVADEIEMLSKMAQHLGAEAGLMKAISIYQNVIASTRPNLFIGSRELFIATCLWWAVRVKILPINVKMIAKSFQLDHRDLQKQYFVLNPKHPLNYSKRAKEDKINLVEKFINRFIQRMNPPLPAHKSELINHCIRHLMTPTSTSTTSTKIAAAPVNVESKLAPQPISTATIPPPSPTSTSILSSPLSTSTTTTTTSPPSIATTIAIISPTTSTSTSTSLSTISTPPSASSTSISTGYPMHQSTSQRPWTIAAAILFKACEMCQCRRSYEEIAALACINPSTVRSAVKLL